MITRLSLALLLVAVIGTAAVPVAAQFTPGYSPDAYEPDDTSAQATYLIPGDTQVHKLHTKTDVDYLYITLPVDRVIDLTLNSGGPWWTITIDVLPRGGSTPILSETGDATIHFTKRLAKGSYDLRISSEGIIGEYDICYISRYVTDVDAYESDNTRATAKDIALTWTQARSLHDGYDEDWAKFTLTEPTEITTTLRPQAANDAAILELQRADGTIVAINDGWMNGEVHAILSSGTYYLRVRARSYPEYLPAYYLTLTCPDDAEPDNQAGDCKELVPGVTQYHSLHSGQDQDMFYFETTEERTVDVEVIAGDPDAPSISIGDSTGQFGGLYWGTYCTGDGRAHWVRTLPAGPQWITVYSLARAIVGGYSIRLTLRPPVATDAYEYDNYKLDCKEIALGEAQVRNLHDSDDRDYIMFNPPAAGDYRITLRSQGGLIGMKLYSWAYDAGVGLPPIAEASTDDESPCTLTLTAPLAKSNYVVYVYLINGGWCPEYTLTAGLPQDAYEADNTPAYATPLLLDTPQTHSISEHADVDWMTLVLTEKTPLKLIITPSSANLQMDLFGPNSSAALLRTATVGGGGTSFFDYTGAGALAPGTYYVRVASASPATTERAYTVKAEACWLPLTGVSLAVGPSARTGSDQPIMLAATPTGGHGVSYRFLYRRTTDDRYTVLRTWGPGALYGGWLPGVGSYIAMVEASENGGRTIVSGRAAVSVAPPLTAAAVVGGPASPTAVGQRVVLMAGTTGGGTLDYRFEAAPLTNGVPDAPTFVRDYATNRNTWWTPDAPGTYQVTAIARERGTSTTATASIIYVVAPKLSALALQLVSPLPGQTAVGVPIKLLAAATGGGTVEYQFLWNYSTTTKISDGIWTKEAYGNGRGYSFIPTKTGWYTFRVYAREKGSTANFQVASADMKFQVKPPVSDFAVHTTSYLSGTTISAIDVVGGVNLEWKFWVRKGGTSTWVLLRDYGSESSYSGWQPVAGTTYVIMVYAREVGSKSTTYDVSRSVTNKY